MLFRPVVHSIDFIGGSGPFAWTGFENQTSGNQFLPRRRLRLNRSSKHGQAWNTTATKLGFPIAISNETLF